MKTFIRTLKPYDAFLLWSNETERSNIRKRLNDLGFYVLTGTGDSLDVYAICDEKAWDTRLLEKVLEKIACFWYTQKRK